MAILYIYIYICVCVCVCVCYSVYLSICLLLFLMVYHFDFIFNLNRFLSILFSLTTFHFFPFPLPNSQSQYNLLGLFMSDSYFTPQFVMFIIIVMVLDYYCWDQHIFTKKSWEVWPLAISACFYLALVLLPLVSHHKFVELDTQRSSHERNAHKTSWLKYTICLLKCLYHPFFFLVCFLSLPSLWFIIFLFILHAFIFFFHFLLPLVCIIIIHSLEHFTSALSDGFSLESEWQQVSSSLQDSS